MQKKTSNGRWFNAVIFLIGLIMGGGGSAFVGHWQYQKVEVRLDRLSEKVSVLGASVARIEGHLKLE